MLFGLLRFSSTRCSDHGAVAVALSAERPRMGGSMEYAARGVVIAVALSVVLHAATAWAEEGDCCSIGSIWTISTRCTDCCCERCGDLDQLRLRHRGADGRWSDATWSHFRAACRSAEPICWFVHGNRTSHEKAVSEGIELGRLFWSRPQGAGLRLVIWSWPSDRAALRHVSDGRIKAARCDLESRLLAACLRQVDPQSPICFVGYSFGARIVCDGLQQLVSSGWARGGIPDSPATHNLRAVLVAAAMDCDWLLPGGRADRAFDPLDSALVTRNCNDPVLRWYSLMYGLRGPKALGRTGVPQLADPDVARRVLTLDVSCTVGHNHGWSEYLQSGPLVEEMRRFTMFSPLSQENGTPDAAGAEPTDVAVAGSRE